MSNLCIKKIYSFLDSGAENLFQFAASVPNVPDNTTTFLDIGADTFSQSLYDDLGDINMSDFPNVGAFTTATSETVITESPVFTMVPASTNSTAALTSVTFPTTTAVTSGGQQVILTKPVTLEKIQPTVATDQHGMLILLYKYLKILIEKVETLF